MDLTENILASWCNYSFIFCNLLRVNKIYMMNKINISNLFILKLFVSENTKSVI